MALGPITSFKFKGKRWKQWQISSSWALKSLQMVTAAMKLKDAYSLGGKKKKTTVTNLDSILKSRNITLPTKVHLIKAMVFPVVMYGCEIWTVKKADCWRNDAFELWCWRRLLRVPWTARRSSQSILKETSPEYSLEGLVLKLKLQYLGHLMRTTEIIRKYPEAGKDWRRKEKGMTEDEMVGWHHQLNGNVWVNFWSWWWTGRPGMLQSMGSQSWTWLSNWTELNWKDKGWFS